MFAGAGRYAGAGDFGRNIRAARRPGRCRRGRRCASAGPPIGPYGGAGSRASQRRHGGRSSRRFEDGRLRGWFVHDRPRDHGQLRRGRADRDGSRGRDGRPGCRRSPGNDSGRPDGDTGRFGRRSRGTGRTWGRRRPIGRRDQRALRQWGVGVTRRRGCRSRWGSWRRHPGRHRSRTRRPHHLRRLALERSVQPLRGVCVRLARCRGHGRSGPLHSLPERSSPEGAGRLRPHRLCRLPLFQPGLVHGPSGRLACGRLEPGEVLEMGALCHRCHLLRLPRDAGGLRLRFQRGLPGQPGLLQRRTGGHCRGVCHASVAVCHGWAVSAGLRKWTSGSPLACSV